LNILKSFGTNGKDTTPKLGTVISIVGELTTGGSVSYVEASAIPSVKVL
jgi:hypothetical protein